MSDHNTIITKLDITWEMKNNAIKNQIFNLKNIIKQNKFKEMTSKTGVLSDIFKDETKDLESMTKKFISASLKLELRTLRIEKYQSYLIKEEA